MKAEIIAVGTELLMGQIANTNAQYLSRELAAIGIGVYYHTTVGDNPGRLKEAIAIARERADVIVFTGGLGPTQDDLTKDVIADVLGLRLVTHQPSLDKIEELFRSRGVAMVESNARQAALIEGGTPLPNDTGLAVGELLEAGGCCFVILPGPPKEMKPMFDRYAKPLLLAKLPGEPLHSRMLKFAGIGESSLEHRLIDLISAQRDPTIAPYASEGEVTIRLTTRAATPELAASKLDPVEAEIRSRLGEHLYANREAAIEEIVAELLKTRGETVAAAESCTGGLFASLLTDVPGSSAVFAGGVVCYTNAVKREMLGVPGRLLEGDGAPGAVSRETAASLAAGVRERLGSDWGVSVTGVAGPAEVEGKPVGLVYVGIAGPDGGGPEVWELKLSGNRETIKLRAAKSTLYRLWRRLTPSDAR